MDGVSGIEACGLSGLHINADCQLENVVCCEKDTSSQLFYLPLPPCKTHRRSIPTNSYTRVGVRRMSPPHGIPMPGFGLVCTVPTFRDNQSSHGQSTLQELLNIPYLRYILGLAGGGGWLRGGLAGLGVLVEASSFHVLDTQ